MDGVPIITYNEKFNSTRKEFRGVIESEGLGGYRKCLEDEKADIIHFHQITSSSGISLFHLKAAKATGAKIVFTNHLAGLTCATGKMLFKNEKQCKGLMRPLQCSLCQLAEFSGTQNNHLTGIPIKSFQIYRHFRNVENKKRQVEELLQLSDIVIVLTEWYYNVLKRNNFLNNKVKLIKQALPFYSLKNNKLFFSPPSPLRLIYVGRIFPEKGLHVLLNAVQDLEDTSFILDIFGQVDAEHYYQECKNLVGKRANILWFPSIDNSEISDTISNYDLLVLPSVVSEMAPLVIHESWSVGVPVAGTNTGGIAEEIKHDYNGWLFEMGDVKGLRDIILSILSKPTKLSEVSRRLPEIRSFDKVAEEVEEVYFSLL